MAMNAVETQPIFLLISYHYFLIRIDNAMEKHDVVVVASPLTMTMTIAVDHDDSDIVVVVAVVEPQSWHDVMTLS